MMMNIKISHYTLVIVTSVFLVLFGNFAFFENILVVYPLNLDNTAFLFSLAVLFVCVNSILLSLICYPKTTKPILIVILLISSFAAYFMDTYNIIIDDLMIDNILKTDIHESLDLLSIQQALYVLLMGVLPSILIYKIRVITLPIKRVLLSNIILFFGSLLLAVVLILSLSDFYASFIREHKSLRFYANPSYYLYSSGKYVSQLFKHADLPLKKIGLDAVIHPVEKIPKLVIFVVGETARSDHFSLNGYQRKTNPLLKKESVISFDNVWACGTSTAYSVPCMFSSDGRSDFSVSQAKSTENVLDILQRVGVNVLWLDNNSDSKGVADRIPYTNFKTDKHNPVCDVECRDKGMLTNLQAYIDTPATGDIFIVLHQMGNHGPAYYKRYTKEFEKFTPICDTNQLEQCSQSEIINTYDNALLYTDDFLSRTIQLLKGNAEKFQTALFYVSDHGESLGENNLYLHGLPYMIAPDTQTHVPMIMWFGENFDQDKVHTNNLEKNRHRKLSHDHLFHTILGLMNIKTQVYDERMDILTYSVGGE